MTEQLSVPEGPSTTILQQVNVPVVSEESCRYSYRSQWKAVIDEKVICAGVGGKDACQVGFLSL